MNKLEGYQEHAMEVKLTAQFATLGKLHEDTEYVWICFHGYGQLAEHFSKPFKQVMDFHRHFCVFPEGLSKLYLDGMTGRVGASWMTKEKRETEIANQQKYLDGIIAELGGMEVLKDKKLILLGFSQGVATVSRWIKHSKIGFDHLVIWAGEFPPDVHAQDIADLPGEKQIWTVVGEQDPFITMEKLPEWKQKIKRVFPQGIRVMTFEGKHTMDLFALHSLIRLIIS